MLADPQVVHEVAEGIRRHALAPYVLDPVMVATSGDQLLEDDAVSAIRNELMPLATLVTPNLHEAGILVGRPIRDVPAMESAARELTGNGRAKAALIKGGHLPGNELVDVLYDGALHHFRHQRIETSHTHGTGCTLSAAVAAHLALGSSLLASVTVALDYVHRAIESAPRLGSGHGPLNHWA
jgi:hydroxymethylpyrimidine/phosphomethylpyrimidine kinase